MTPDTIKKIEALTPSDYVSAFQRIVPTEHQLEMLRIHSAAPGHTLTARHLALALGYEKWNAANLHYGKFAHKVCIALSVEPTTHLSILVEFFKPNGGEYELILRPSVVTALTEIGVTRNDHATLQEELSVEQPLVEGVAYLVQVSAFERNPVARQKCISHYGLSCMICGFNFQQVYGISAGGYIHVHHLRPLASIGERYVISPVEDLRPVCANCHSVIHLRNPPYSIEEVKRMLSGDGNA